MVFLLKNQTLACFGSTSIPPWSTQFQKKKHKRSYQLSRSLTRSLKNPSNCHPSHSGTKQLLEYQPTWHSTKNLSTKKSYLAILSIPNGAVWLTSHLFLHISPLPSLQYCYLPHQALGLQQELVTYSNTELTYCTHLNLCINLFTWRVLSA